MGKFNYHLTEPKRWDVAVFRFPGKAATNYIKRIAGLPKETLRIWHGDIWTKPDGAADFTHREKVARQDPGDHATGLRRRLRAAPGPAREWLYSMARRDRHRRAATLGGFPRT